MWRPILDGDAAAAARAVVDEIARALHDPPPPYDGRLVDEGLCASLMAREPGFALFFHYLGDRTRAQAQLGRAWDAVPQIADSRPFYAYGFAGTAWAVAHLMEGADDLVADVDGALLELVRALPVDGDLGVRKGIAGYGVYALERLPAARPLLEAVIERLAAARDWRTARSLYAEGVRDHLPERVDDLGLWDGALGPLAVAGAAAGAGIAGARELFERGATWVWSLARPKAEARWFAGLDPRVDDAAYWCSGEVGIAGALHAAAAAAGARDWQGRALEHARALARRPLRVAEATLCHGACGAAQVWMRLHDATDDPLFAEAARGALETALGYHRPGEPLAGFRTWSPPEDAALIPELDAGWVALPGLLKGAAGIGLTLLAACGVEPAWDRALLLSTRRFE